jgi:hypothetical protein
VADRGPINLEPEEAFTTEDTEEKQNEEKQIGDKSE